MQGRLVLILCKYDAILHEGLGHLETLVSSDSDGQELQRWGRGDPLLPLLSFIIQRQI